MWKEFIGWRTSVSRHLVHLFFSFSIPKIVYWIPDYWKQCHKTYLLPVSICEVWLISLLTKLYVLYFMSLTHTSVSASCWSCAFQEQYKHSPADRVIFHHPVLMLVLCNLELRCFHPSLADTFSSTSLCKPTLAALIKVASILKDSPIVCKCVCVCVCGRMCVYMFVCFVGG